MIYARAYGLGDSKKFEYELCSGIWTEVNTTMKLTDITIPSPISPLVSLDVGCEYNIFSIQILDDQMNQWTRCNTTDMLAFVRS